MEKTSANGTEEYVPTQDADGNLVCPIHKAPFMEYVIDVPQEEMAIDVFACVSCTIEGYRKRGYDVEAFFPLAPEPEGLPQLYMSKPERYGSLVISDLRDLFNRAYADYHPREAAELERQRREHDQDEAMKDWSKPVEVVDVSSFNPHDAEEAEQWAAAEQLAEMEELQHNAFSGYSFNTLAGVNDDGTFYAQPVFNMEDQVERSELEYTIPSGLLNTVQETLTEISAMANVDQKKNIDFLFWVVANIRNNQNAEGRK